MPAKAPPSGPKLKKILSLLGEQIRQHRKSLKVSTITTSEAAGISRMTLNRVERGDPSVTFGAYLKVMSVLGLEFTLNDIRKKRRTEKSKITKKTKISLSRYPQLKKLAWQIKKDKALTPEEAMNLYERNWRHIDLANMKEQEKELIRELLKYLGKERVLV